jgi:hypothetical protein
MLPNLINLIIIFGKLGDGDPSADKKALVDEGFFYFYWTS